MCWNVRVSAASAVLGWVVCAYLWRRQYSARDRWYAKYLATFTLTQLVDLLFWTLHEGVEPLVGCPELREQFSARLPGNGASSVQVLQYLVTKLLIPCIVFLQFFVQFSYNDVVARERQRLQGRGQKAAAGEAATESGPASPGRMSLRAVVTGLHGLGTVGMSFAFACTDVVTALWPAPHDSLRWGGYSAQTIEVLIVVGIVCADFCLLMEDLRPRIAHVAVFLSVVSFLWMTEGTLAVGSKWCTYCLIFSVVYSLDPVWGPGPDAPRVASSKSAAATPSLTASMMSPRTPVKEKAGCEARRVSPRQTMG